ncbi:MAG TPA: nuclear transport factor 2 family protein [Candidatus Limnocylindria bacterium]|jgi:ketosteroid isomerase-like protein|nr:nuclear transport factor 2 family protein [Candidatus Limnocylindria bacterium]
MKRSFLAVLVLVLLAGCAGSRSKKTNVTRMVNTSALEADLAFARLAMQLPPAEAFARYTDDRSMELPPGGPPVVGQQAISASLEGLPAGALEWHPQGGEIALSGDIAWTWGDYLLHSATGETTGKYISIWHRRRDGSWFLAVDMGNQVLPKP